ncbi:probable cytochrome P450 6a14 [Ochlerotatus camptorhynchus]|uniref:probable cytochrome P450 6a14 n=1 Tax=Ochlerotatus camptorhynchus TaxID=644619 RepID=UPI0031D68012
MGLLIVLFVPLLAVVIALLGYLKWIQGYWQRRDVPAARNTHILFGNVAGMGTKVHMAITLQKIYREFKERGLAFGGFNNFFAPTILAVDPEFVKLVLVKEFNVFHDHGFYTDPEKDPLNSHLFNLDGAQWRVMRQKLSPTFTSGKMKMMFVTVQSVADELKKYVESNYHREDLEIRDLMQRFTTDVIGSVAFGLECNSFKDPDSKLRKMAAKVFELSPKILLQIFVGIQFKGLARWLKLKVTDDEVENFFMELVKSTVEIREKEQVQRNDFIKLLLEIKNNGKLSNAPDSGGDGLTMNELAAQCFVFFAAGFETSSTTMNFCLYELALAEDIQDRLREEINEVLGENDGQLTYDALMKMDYLDRVLNETLRKYPPLDNTFRMNSTDYTVPGTNYTIPAGTFVQIPMFALQNDPDHFPDPDRFDPDRFLPEVVKSRHPYAYVPFGEGPRICIGMRFGVMQAKIGLVSLLQSFRFRVNSRTLIPMEFEPASVTLSPKIGMYLQIERVK